MKTELLALRPRAFVVVARRVELDDSARALNRAQCRT
jgi:hypothetical protein